MGTPATQARKPTSLPPHDEPCPAWGRLLGGHKAGPGLQQAGPGQARTGRQRPGAPFLTAGTGLRGSAAPWRLPGLEPRPKPGLRRPKRPPLPLGAGCWRCSGPSCAHGESAAAGLHVEPGCSPSRSAPSLTGEGCGSSGASLGGGERGAGSGSGAPLREA